LADLGRKRHLHINELSAFVAHRVIVSRELTVVVCSIRAKLDLAYKAFVLEISQRVVNGRERDTGQEPASILKDLIGRQVLVGLADHLQNGLTLFRQP